MSLDVNPARKVLINLTASKKFNNIMLSVIGINTLIMALQTDDTLERNFGAAKRNAVD